MIYAKLIAGAVLLGLIGWGLTAVYNGIHDRGHRRGVAETVKNEQDCIEGSVCAMSADRRAEEQRQIVANAQQAAKVKAEDAAAAQIEQEKAAREAAESRATAARASASAAERRFQQALAINQACAAWAAAPVPCPLTSE